MLGTPHRNAAGEIDNAVLLLHGTSGTGKNWLMPSLADELFAPGQPLDAAKYFIVMPDGIGRGGSSKPSDGLRAKFPHYRYDDIIDAAAPAADRASRHQASAPGAGQLDGRHALLDVGRDVSRTSWTRWCRSPASRSPISGRNWLSRRIAIEAIRNDPDWNNGNYTTKPTHYIRTAPFASLMTESPVRLQEMAPTREAADDALSTAGWPTSPRATPTTSSTPPRR